MLARAITIATCAHEGQFDKGGAPYILHPLWVMNAVRHLGPVAMIVGVLHDVLEDTSVTLEDLQNQGIDDPNILQALKLLDFRDAVDYQTRIGEIKHNPLAREVKLRDLEHNSKITRMKGVRPKDFERLQKYSQAYHTLKYSMEVE